MLITLSNSLFALAIQPKAIDFAKQAFEKYRRGDLQGAIADYTQAVQVSPAFTNAYIERGIAYHDAGDLSHALADLNRAVQLEPNNALADWQQAAKLFEERGDRARYQQVQNTLKQLQQLAE